MRSILKPKKSLSHKSQVDQNYIPFENLGDNFENNLDKEYISFYAFCFLSLFYYFLSKNSIKVINV